MTSYVIVVDDDDRSDAAITPWTANVYQDIGDGKTGDTLGAGFGSTPERAVREALDDARSHPEDADARAFTGGAS